MPRTYYPLTFSQHLMYYNLAFSVMKSIIDICAVMHFESDVQPELVLQATTLALLRNTSASIRMHKDENKKICQYFSEQPPEPVLVLDYSDKTEEQLQEDLNKWAKTPMPNKSMDVQLYTVRLIKKPNGKYCLYFCVSHLAFDAYALMQTASDLLDIYVALRDQKPIPANKNNPLSSFEADWAYVGSEKHKKDLAYYQEHVFDTEPQYYSLNGPDAPECKKKTHSACTIHLFKPQAAQIHKRLPKELVSQVNALAKELRIPPQCVYILACRSFFGNIHGGLDDFIMIDTIARRASKLEKNAGGTRVLGTFFRTRIPRGKTFREACRITCELMYENFAHANVSTLDVIGLYHSKYNIPKMNGYTNLNLTYQPYAVAARPGVSVRFETICNGASAQQLYLTIMAVDESGDLDFGYEYNKSWIEPSVVEALHAYMLKFLNRVIEHQDDTLDQLMRL